MLAVYYLAKPKPHFMMRGSFEKVINWMGDGRQRKLVILRINTLKCANFFIEAARLRADDHYVHQRCHLSIYVVNCKQLHLNHYQHLILCIRPRLS